MAESVTSAVPSSFASMPGWLFFADVWLSLCVAVGKETSDERRAAIPSGAPGMVPEWVRYVRGGEAWTTKAERAEVT